MAKANAFRNCPLLALHEAQKRFKNIENSNTCCKTKQAGLYLSFFRDLLKRDCFLSKYSILFVVSGPTTVTKCACFFVRIYEVVHKKKYRDEGELILVLSRC